MPVLGGVETHNRPTRPVSMQVHQNKCIVDQGREPCLLSISEEGSSSVVRQYRIGEDCQLTKLG